MRHILLIIICCISMQFVFGQERKTAIVVNMGPAFFTTGDLWGGYYQNSVRMPIGKIFAIKPTITIGYASAPQPGAAGYPGYPGTYISSDHDDPFEAFDQTYESELEAGFGNFASHQDRSFYGVIDVRFSVEFKKGRNLFALSVGPSLAYIDQSYVTQARPAVVHDQLEGPVNASVLVYFYHRYLDFGVSADLSYSYDLSDKISLGPIINYQQFLDGDRLYSLAVSVGFNLN